MDAGLSEGAIWTWGLALIAVTIAIHATGVVMIALVGVRIRIWSERGHVSLRYGTAIVIGVIGMTGLLLAVLHGIEAAIWAAVYLWFGALHSPVAAMLYSIDSMTTRGASGLSLQQPWLMMGALEAADGVLLFGISTAYMFGVLQAYWPLLHPTSPTPRASRKD